MSRSIGRKVPGFSLLSNANKLGVVPFSSSSSGGHGRGRGRGAFPSGPFDFTPPVPSQEHPNASKQEPIDSRPTPGLGHGRGIPTPSSPIRPSFSSFSPSVRPSSVGRGRGDASPSIRSPPEPDSEPKKPVFFSRNNAGDSAASTSLGGLHRVSGERNLPDSLHSGFSGVGRGKPMKQPVPEDQPKQENRHLRPRQEGDGRGAGGRGRARGVEPRIGRGEPWRNTNRMASRGGPDGEVGGGRGSSGYRGRGVRGPFRRGPRGSFRTGERWDRRSGQDKEDGYAAGLYLGNNEDGERLAKKVGPEIMNQLVEGFEEMSGRVLPSPLEDRLLDGMDINFMIECEPEYLMGDFESNPDIDENPPISLRDAFEKMKPFLMAYENIQSHEEWEEIVEETMQSVPLMKEIVDAYSGPDRVTAKEQQGELERVAKTLPQSAPNSVKQFTNRAVLSLQSNPGWGFDKKCQFMDKLVGGFSQRYK
ncbi:hypothetical protein IC582_016776 [Cucumis melo]|uniref:Translation initiation factor IF-2 n=2 Tax=Cucumis melo TaxID=3656 RepID=A0A1S3BT69_CUCME|nr:uncharacterized protein LOC103492997 [Cucumis melo]KAA0062949.1 translation initiation factor IF-2 [Cucumis melo var. makuwa]TYK16394.1 translation initiation factor IF-2 [Cucumis melo var. makuwa]